MTVFVMMPYTDAFRAIYETAIQPAIRANRLDSVLGEDESTPGPINEQTIQAIKTSRLCIADLTEANPNVMYEVAIAHESENPVILITQGTTEDIPFDIRHHRVIHYTSTSDGLDPLRKKLRESIKAVLHEEQSDKQLLRRMLTPASLGTNDDHYVVAANPLTYRAAFRSRGGWLERPLVTYSDHVGIRGLMQSFGLIYGLDKYPELLNPDDFDDKVLDNNPMNLYTIGSSKVNRWTKLMMERFFENRNPKWEFKPNPESKNILNPRVIIRRNKVEYEPDVTIDTHILKWDFGMVIRGPHPVDSSFMFMVLAGRGSLGTEAACLAATNPECLRVLNERLLFEKVDLDDHKKAFCAFVSIHSSKLRTNKETFKVENVILY